MNKIYINNELYDHIYVPNKHCCYVLKGKDVLYNDDCIKYEKGKDGEYARVVGVKSGFSLIDLAAFVLYIPSKVNIDGTLYEVTNINKQAFIDCSTLKRVVTFDGLKTIGDNAFQYCVDLKEVVISDTVTSIDSFAFFHSGLTSVTIPDKVTHMGKGVFYECDKLERVIWNAEECTIEMEDGNYPIFQYCNSLTEVAIGKNVKTIPGYVFCECRKLTSVVIPDSVTSIGDSAFENCSELADVTVKSETPPILGNNNFLDTNLQKIIVPTSSVDKYKAADVWKNYSTIITGGA